MVCLCYKLDSFYIMYELPKHNAQFSHICMESFYHKQQLKLKTVIECPLRPKMFIYKTSTSVPTLNASTHHFDGHTGQVLVIDRCAVAFHHIYSFPGKSLDDGQVGLKTRRLLRLEDKRVHTAVELPRQHEADDGRLDVLLVVLVGVKWVP